MPVTFYQKHYLNKINIR